MENKEVKETTALEKVTKALLKQLIEKKLAKDGKVGVTKEIYVESLGGTITCVNPTDYQRITFLETNKSREYPDMLKAYSRLIYDCCPMLHSKELQESIEVDYPYDTVGKIFEIDEIFTIGPKILNFFDDDEEEVAEDKVKN